MGISQWQKCEFSVFKAKKWKYVVFFLSNNYYIYFKIFWNIWTNDIFSVFWRSAVLKRICWCTRSLWRWPGSVFIKHLKSSVYVTLNAIGSFQCNLCSHSFGWFKFLLLKFFDEYWSTREWNWNRLPTPQVLSHVSSFVYIVWIINSALHFIHIILESWPK